MIVYAWPDRAMASESTAEPKVTNSIDLSSVSNGVASEVENVSSQSIVRRGSSSSASWRVKWRWKILEVAVLSCVIVAAWGLSLAPTIVYALPSQQSNAEETFNISFLCADNLDSDECLNVLTRNDTRICAEGFYLANNSQTLECAPLCNFWIPALEFSAAEDVIFVTSMFVAIIVSIILIVMALWLQRDTILVYPTFYLVYTCVAVALVAPILIAGVLGKEKLFCSSKNFLESSEKPTPFCTISGIAHTYLILQITLWGAFHALGLCWGIVFPFHYRRFKMEGRIKYVHVITVVLGLVLPAISALVPLIDGYTITPSPIDHCVVRNMTIHYFTSILPISVLVAASSAVLIILFWIILKEFVLQQSRESQRSRRHIGIAEVKICIIACYYIIMGCLGLSAFTYLTTTDVETTLAFQDYFTCHSYGIVPGLDCGDPPNLRLQVFATLASLSISLIGLIPLVNLIFTVKWTCKCFVKKRLYTKSLKK